MTSQLKAVTLCSQIYNPIPENIFSHVFSVNKVTVGLAIIDGINTFTFAGSEDITDWLRDADIMPIDTVLGTISSGAWDGMEQTFDTLKPFLIDKISISGHSLGAMHAIILAGLCAINNIPVDQLTLFAPPKLSYQYLVDIVNKHVNKIYAYRNGIDPVPEVPIDTYLTPWTQIDNYIMLNIKPEGYDEFDPIKWHSVLLYMKGVENNNIIC